ncbi:MAG: tetratricopeptide repeat protein [Sedimentisphaerales bacterium]|nr:tetratricopeptide repeat protein [Sedimentisphaerales bacterium]
MDRNPDKTLFFIICLALTIVIIAVYYQIWTYDFVSLDDFKYVRSNPDIHSGITFEAVKWVFTTGYMANWHPVTWLSHMLDWRLFGSNPGAHHITNLIFHIANTLLLFVVLKQMTSALWPSAFAAALFALHPLHVESVAWISERKDVLSTFFWLLTMWAYVRFVHRPKILRYLLVVVFFALGLMSKPMLVTLPFVLLLLDYWPLRRCQNNRLGRLVLEKIPLFILSAASVVVTFFVQRNWGAVATAASVPLKFRVFNALISYTGYIGKMFWPSRLAPFYPHPGRDISLLHTAVSTVLLLAITIVVLRFAKSRRYLFTGWFWYLGTLVPVIGLVQVGSQAMADRYSYITLTGLFIMIAWGMPDMFANWHKRKTILWTASLIVLAMLAMSTYVQKTYWKNSLTLGRRSVTVTQDNYVAHFCLSGDLHERQMLDEAMYHCLEALRIRPDSIEAIRRQGDILQSAGRFAQAVEAYQKCLKAEPNDIKLLNNIGVALSLNGKTDQAVENFNKALKIDPDFAACHANLGYALQAQGKKAEAMKHFERAFQIDPNYTIP